MSTISCNIILQKPRIKQLISCLQQIKKMQIQNFKYKYKNARRTITCNILPQKPRIMRLISCLGQTSSHTFFASTSNLNQMRFGEGQWLLYHLNLFVSFKGKKMYIYVQIFIKYEDWRPLILRRYDSNSKFQFKFMLLLCV